MVKKRRWLIGRHDALRRVWSQKSRAWRKRKRWRKECDGDEKGQKLYAIYRRKIWLGRLIVIVQGR